MCGIAGFTRFKTGRGDQALLQQMGQVILHRGPDAGGEYLDDEVGLCHRRLSIIDLSAAGNQPMHSVDGKLVIVFNGEIYNFQPLRQELLAQGYAFASRTDTEVLMALYQRDGADMVTKINGMFAFAIWDREQRTLFLARDRLGKKPLYYYPSDDGVVFGSELKSLMQMPGVPRRIRADAVYDFFAYQYVPDPKTIFEDIYKLEPGHTLTVTPEGITRQQYWNLSFQHPIALDTGTGAKGNPARSETQIADELLNLIRDAVASRMISDVPLGAFLSGGVDSSGVVGLMAQSSPKPVTTCSIGFDSQEFDEVDFAREIARQFKTDHHEFTVRENVPANLERIAAFFDEPFADPSLVPTYFVSQLARQQVTVALAGDGGDEDFAGYAKYAVDAMENRLRNRVPGFVRHKIMPALARLLAGAGNPLLRKAHTLCTTLSRDPAYGFFLTNSFFRQHLWDDLVTDSFSARLKDYHPADITLRHYQEAPAEDHLSRILYTDFKTYLPGDILVKVDRMSMANSLEVRAPLLDYQVVEYAAKIPSALKLNNGDKKYILKRAFSKLLSHDTLYRKKMGFSVPLADWLRHEIKDQAEDWLFNSPAGVRDYFKLNRLRQIWDQHQSGQQDYSSELWSMVMFQLWFNRYGVEPSP
ncbi:MAG: asparagine synthase (glutamine-hydrolyzing) [Pseudomonadales bacterium]|nr:asparagine synthase (glutamine-hydrolyzing) [Pseudomonadales bacterium]